MNELIERANEEWDERNAAAIAAGEKEMPPMLPLVRLKVLIKLVIALSWHTHSDICRLIQRVWLRCPIRSVSAWSLPVE